MKHMSLWKTHGPCRRVALTVGLVTCISVSLCQAILAVDDPVTERMTWMTQYPATWNAGAPKLVGDGLHMYAVVCGAGGAQDVCSIARKRGDESWLNENAATFRSNQPAVAVLDRKARLNVFFNNPALRHIRFDHPAVDLKNYVEIPVRFGMPVGYLHASYDAASDTLLVAFNETSSWATYLMAKSTDAPEWSDPAPLPVPDPAGSMYLYARTVRAGGRYVVLTGEHPRNSANASFTAAVLFESATLTGPWSVRVLHRATGENVGVPYSNWVIPTDVQVDFQGRVRALMHVVESGSGHPPRAEGLHIAREEDGYTLRHVGGAIDDGFVLQVDPSGLHLAFALMLSVPAGPTANRLAIFRSIDNGATWQGPHLIVGESALNPVPMDPRNGSMVFPRELPFLYSAPIPPPWERVMQGAVTLGVKNTAQRFETRFSAEDGTHGITRAYTDPASERSYRSTYTYRPNGSFEVTYTYRAGSYMHVYESDASGLVRYYNSEGVRFSSMSRR
jgi:hypothetical protein